MAGKQAHAGASRSWSRILAEWERESCCTTKATPWHVFKPFRQATSDRKHSAAGLGLGLFIVEQIAHAHGGTVTVRSTETEGTTFTVKLPRHAHVSARE